MTKEAGKEDGEGRKDGKYRRVPRKSKGRSTEKMHGSSMVETWFDTVMRALHGYIGRQEQGRRDSNTKEGR